MTLRGTRGHGVRQVRRFSPSRGRQGSCLSSQPPVCTVRNVPTSVYPVFDITSWELAGIETAGASEHQWFRGPTDELWLFKPVVDHIDWQQGEDWAEKIACELGMKLNLPVAKVQLARKEDSRGCISLRLKESKWEMQPGAVLLKGRDPSYESQARGRPGHSLAAIQAALEHHTAPPTANVPHEFRAFDVFAGYLVFDALIGNRDRHDENWSVLRPPPGSTAGDALCGSYDHASSLGFNLRDEYRKQKLSERSVEAWATNGTAWRFEHERGTRPATLVSLADSALGRCAPNVRAHWMGAVESVTSTVIDDIVSAVPALSDATATFVRQLVGINRERLLREC